MKNKGCDGGGGGACHDWGVTFEALCVWGVIAVKMAIRDCYKSTHMGEKLKEKGKKKKRKSKDK